MVRTVHGIRFPRNTPAKTRCAALVCSGSLCSTGSGWKLKFEALMRIAGSQHGCITRTQALTVMSRGRLAYLIKTRVVERVHPGVFVVAGMPSTWEQRAFAAVLSIPGAALSHRSAARWQGVSYISSPCIEITVAPGRSKKRAGVLVHRSEQLEPYVIVHKGLRVTNIARSLVDSSATRTVKQLGAAVDQACNLKLVQLDEIRHCLDTMITKGRSRITLMREVLAARNISDEKLDSFLERRSLKWIRSSELPEPETQFPIFSNGSNYRLDIAYPDVKVAVEPDGPHHLLPSVAAYDRRRDADLGLDGWVVFHAYLETSEFEVLRFIRTAHHRRSAA